MILETDLVSRKKAQKATTDRRGFTRIPPKADRAHIELPFIIYDLLFIIWARLRWHYGG
jgi:hypothetical protein